MNPHQPMTVPEACYGVTVTTTTGLRHLCPHRDETDDGTVTVSWTITDRTIELHSLAAYFAGWAGVRISHEELTATISADLATTGVHKITVRTAWSTAGMSITTDSAAPPIHHRHRAEQATAPADALTRRVDRTLFTPGAAT